MLLCCLPPKLPTSVQPWSKSFSLEGVALTVSVSRSRGSDTKVEIQDRGVVRSASLDDLYADDSATPFLRIEGKTAYLAYPAYPGAGSGQYASIWRIGDRGRALKYLGAFREADLRQWFRSGVIREVRPAKYATKDVLRTYPSLFQSTKLLSKTFILSYRFDRKDGCFKYLRLKTVRSLNWPEEVRFPTTSPRTQTRRPAE